jgi:Domain of Unknown Function (DUF1521)
MATGAISSGAPVAITLTPSDGTQPLIAAVVLADPLSGPAAAQAHLPTTADVTLCVVPTEQGSAPCGSEVFKVAAISVGSAVIDLSDGYSLTVDERDSAVFVANATNGERLRIWGAAEIQLSGAEKARFWGTTSVVLGNGAKLTLETARDIALADTFRLDRLTVIQNDHALVITGVSSDTQGDLTFIPSNNGIDVDDATRDGLTLIEHDCGWTDEYGHAVTPETLALTASDAPYGPGSSLLSLGEICTIIGRFMVFRQVTSLSSLWSPARQFEAPMETRDARAGRRAELQYLQMAYDPSLASRRSAFSNAMRDVLI